MDYLTVLNEVDSWDVADRIRFVQDVWERLADDDDDSDITEAWKAELDRRVEEIKRNPAIGVPWEEVKARLVEKFGE